VQTSRHDNGDTAPVARAVARGVAMPDRCALSLRISTMSPQTDAERELAELLVESLNLEDVAPEAIDPDAPLFNTGLGLDSIDALELRWRSASVTASSCARTTTKTAASSPRCAHCRRTCSSTRRPEPFICALHP
jgi:hypothetical protein